MRNYLLLEMMLPSLASPRGGSQAVCRKAQDCRISGSPLFSYASIEERYAFATPG